jgi:hypothetical protein
MQRNVCFIGKRSLNKRGNVYVWLAVGVLIIYVQDMKWNGQGLNFLRINSWSVLKNSPNKA